MLDNGLASALTTLATSSAIPASVSADIGTRPAPAIETIAYFCAAELIANATKHSYANEIKIKIHTERSGVLRLEVSDDGVGGADAGRGSGLTGLAQRVSTVDGRIDVSSPPGGPTTVTVDAAAADLGETMMRVVIAEDAALLREGLIRLLEDRGHSICAAVSDGDALVAAVVDHRPDVSIVDIRLPPSQRDEGLRAALEVRRLRPAVACSCSASTSSANRPLLADRSGRRRLPAQGPDRRRPRFPGRPAAGRGGGPPWTRRSSGS